MAEVRRGGNTLIGRQRPVLLLKLIEIALMQIGTAGGLRADSSKGKQDSGTEETGATKAIHLALPLGCWLSSRGCGFERNNDI
jgi:hypothetical protein